jgi:hypothetical protein
MAADQGSMKTPSSSTVNKTPEGRARMAVFQYERFPAYRERKARGERHPRGPSLISIKKGRWERVKIPKRETPHDRRE